MQLFTVGQVSKKTGISVRALHHYESIGLLIPTGRTGTGYRLYSLPDIKKLQHIILLRRYQFSLDIVKEILNSNNAPKLIDTIATQIQDIEKSINKQSSILNQLKKLQQALATNQSVNGVLFQTIEELSMHEKYYTEQQLIDLENQETQLGTEKISSIQQRWPELISEVKQAMASGIPTDSKQVIALAQEWKQLINVFTGGDKQVFNSLSNMYQSEENLQDKTGISPELLEYIHSAFQFI